ncbi:MAG: DUF3795 domain-containing protein [bacterium]
MSEKTDRREFMKCVARASVGIVAGGLGCAKSKKDEGTEPQEMIAYCGIKCHECGALIATKNNDDVKRKEVSEEWSKQYGANIKPEDINCDGCLSEGGRLIQHCNVCEIRKCGKEKRVLNCAHCNEYACEKLEEFLKMVPDARKTLDAIKSSLA